MMSTAYKKCKCSKENVETEGGEVTGRVNDSKNKMVTCDLDMVTCNILHQQWQAVFHSLTMAIHGQFIIYAKHANIY